MRRKYMPASDALPLGRMRSVY